MAEVKILRHLVSKHSENLTSRLNSASFQMNFTDEALKTKLCFFYLSNKVSFVDLPHFGAELLIFKLVRIFGTPCTMNKNSWFKNC